MLVEEISIDLAELSVIILRVKEYFWERNEEGWMLGSMRFSVRLNRDIYNVSRPPYRIAARVNIQVARLTRTPTLIKAYAYAKFLATSLSSEALNKARARVPTRTEMFNHDIHAIQPRKSQFTFAAEINTPLLSLANHTLPSTLTGVAIFLGTLTWDPPLVMAW
jgi:hypothetical protein